MSDAIHGKISGGSKLTGRLHTQPVGSDTYQGYNLSDLVHGTEVERVIKLSQAEFDSLLQKDPEILYVVVGG